MHPTRDTLLLMFPQSGWRAGDARVRLLGYIKSMTEACGLQPRAASLSGRRTILGGAALRIILRVASREVPCFEYRGSREARIISIAHPNKPMHPTADTNDVIKSNRPGRRVIGGVRLLCVMYVGELCYGTL